jgi:5'-3' exonuclease
MIQANQYLAFDTSFVVFHQYFVALRQDEKHYGTDLGSCSRDEQKARRLQHFANVVLNTVRLKVEYYGVEMKKTVFMLDCPRSEIWRKDELPEYKETRVKGADFDTCAFAHMYEVILPELIRQGAHVLSFTTAEADDIAGGLARWVKRTDVTGLVIVSGDSDFAQLVEGAVRVHDMMGRCVLEKTGVCDPKIMLIRKILSGDKSDNIGPVKPRLGPKTAAKLSDDADAMRELLADEVVKAVFERNEMLIDLDKSPETLRVGIDAMIDRALPGSA